MQIGAIIVKTVATWLMKVGVSKAIAYTVASWALKIAVSVGAAALMRGAQPKPRGMQQGVELQTKTDPTYPREVGVGKFATGGSLVLEWTSGTNNKYLWRVIAISDAEINAITQVRGNGEALTFSGDIHTGLRDCTSHFQSASGADMLSLRIYKGTQSQTADADLLAALTFLDSNFRGRGVAYAILRMTYNTDAWSSGADFVFVGEGALLPDPRGPTTAFSENPALIAAAYLRGFENNGIRVVGLGATEDDLTDEDIEAAADECDDAVAIAAGGTEARYRAGGMISAQESGREVMGELMIAMAGAHVDRGGQITILPGVARTPVMDIAESDFVADEGVVYVDKRTSDERFNAISSTFVNPDDGWQQAPLPPRKNATAITEDGGRLERNPPPSYSMVYSKPQGQRLDEIELRRVRCEGFLAFTMHLGGFELTPGDWFTATNKRWGNVEKTFEVETIALVIVNGKGGAAPQARCSITAREISSTVFDWDESDEIIVTSDGLTHAAALSPNIDAFGRLNGAFYSGNPLITGAVVYRTPVNPLSSFDAGATATIEIDDHTLKTSRGGAELEVVFTGGSITGRPFATGHHIFALDEEFDGGAVSYVHDTTTANFLPLAEYVYIGAVTTVADGGGGGGDDPPFCVEENSWLRADLQAKDAKAGDELDILNPAGDGWIKAKIESVERARVPGLRIVTKSGTLVCSHTTPVTQADGSVALAAHALHWPIAVVDADGVFRWEPIEDIDFSPGIIDVVRIHIGGKTYAAGERVDQVGIASAIPGFLRRLLRRLGFRLGFRLGDDAAVVRLFTHNIFKED